MKINRTQKWIGAGIFALAMLLGGVAFNSTANAQNDRYDRYQTRRTRNWDNYGNYGGSFELRQTALNAGYNEGLRDGTAARSRNRYADFASQSSYRKATKDYSSRLGDRNIYQRYFREAYQTGFNDGYNPGSNANYDNNRDRNRDWSRNNSGWDPNNRNNSGWDPNNRRGRNWDRYDNYGGNSNLRQTALNAGYNEGIKEGRKDRGRGPSDFRNNSAYQRATTDYSSRLGDVNLYQRYYRAGYENGYYDGLNGN